MMFTMISSILRQNKCLKDDFSQLNFIKVGGEAHKIYKVQLEEVGKIMIFLHM